MVHLPYKNLIFLIFLILVSPVFGEDPGKGDVTVGIEGKVVVDFPEPDIKSVPIDKSADLILRIGDISKKGNSYTYELFYIGMIPGRHNLTEYLLYRNDTPLVNTKPIYVNVKRKLPKKHSGMLTKINPYPVSGMIWYAPLMVAVLVLWMVLLYPLIFYKRKKKEVVTPPIPLPTVAERLQPLVLKASDGELTIEEKAHLEDLIMLYWCKRTWPGHGGYCRLID